MTARFCVVFLAAAMLIAASSRTSARPGDDQGGPEVGKAAPEFSLPWADRNGFHLDPKERISLSGLKGKVVVLAFYPADWSPGCTAEVCTLRDDAGFKDLAKLDAVILGVSGDYVFSHFEWAKHHDLPFALLSDHDHAVARLYGSYNEAAGFNKRTVVVVDRDGVVRYKNMGFGPKTAADYEALKKAVEAARGANK